jgi:transposase-like protein
MEKKMGKEAMVVEEAGVETPTMSGGERSEPERRGGGAAPALAPVAGIVDPEVDSKARRRQFSAAYKRRILDEADKGGPGTVASLLRREGLYSSHLSTWRRQRESGELAGLEPRRRGKKPAPKNPLAGEVHRLERENRHLQKRLRQAEIIIDVQKKLCDVLGLTVPPIEQSEDDE